MKVLKYKATFFPNGVSDADIQGTLQEYAALDDTKFHKFFDDFDVFNTNDWAITYIGGAGTEVVRNEDGGIFHVTTNSNNGNATRFAIPSNTFTFEEGKRLFLKVRTKIDDVINTDFYTGLVDSNIFSPSEGISFQKPTSTGALAINLTSNFIVESFPLEQPMEDDTYIELGYAYNGKSTLSVFIDEVEISKIPVDTSSTYFNKPFTIETGLINQNASAHDFFVDYIFLAKER